jgi:hypothetical protein
MVPNHALIILGLLYGEWRFPEIADDLQHGWLGYRLQLRQPGLPARDSQWPERPSMDRSTGAARLPTASTCPRWTAGAALQMPCLKRTRSLISRAVYDNETPVVAKDAGHGDCRFHFELPGSVQGFRTECGSASLENTSRTQPLWPAQPGHPLGS